VNDSTKSKTEAPIFSLEKIYLKDASFELPGGATTFTYSGQPEIQIQIGLKHSILDAGQNLYEVVLTATVSAKLGDKTMFLIEAQQAGIFAIRGVPAELLDRVLEINCPSVLLPFAREAVSDLIGKGGFPPVLISPVNFEALFEQKRAAAQQAPVAGHA
jgi:preprotein translocase subunit SecB